MPTVWLLSLFSEENNAENDGEGEKEMSEEQRFCDEDEGLCLFFLKGSGTYFFGAAAGLSVTAVRAKKKRTEPYDRVLFVRFIWISYSVFGQGQAMKFFAFFNNRLFPFTYSVFQPCQGQYLTGFRINQ